MTPEVIFLLLGGGSVVGVVVDRLVTWLVGRRKERISLADQSTQMAERLLVRMDAQLAGAETKLQLAETQMAAANLTIAQLREELTRTKGEVAQLRAELRSRQDVSAERDRLLVENAQLKAQVISLGGQP
ncbi:hypothetical protein [Micromonospora endophytica]|uniref:Uncharacterized protein n=1 Tax=Micromonospora endophytica TaxID=515350 RepID=A0A2W2DF80_9ACTN|nr:hypothetical protein [Micromonospora endophytica]PZF99419.1 hypothetical protein C1I93_06050 [Micromonospora endophytica]RIW42872.1 hypothetical protein D3H59_21845 [Micromonospora endophytica]BCJ61613.1 hypothetical protein Jiend_50350 [Micromonospora endophytica]